MALEVLNKVKTESVFKHTGKHWDEWVKALKKDRADQMARKDIVQHLKKKYKLKMWWQQIVASAFEVYLGRKVEGENQKGEFGTTITKTMKRSQKKTWDFLFSEEGLNIWLKPLSPFKPVKGQTFEVEGGIFGEVRTVKAPARIRMTWQDSEMEKKTILQIWVLPRPQNKSLLVFTHDQCKTPAIKNEFQKRWKKAVEDLG